MNIWSILVLVYGVSAIAQLAWVAREYGKFCREYREESEIWFVEEAEEARLAGLE